MSFLKKKVRKVIPVWVILVITIGTAAGAYLWISNTMSTIVVVEGPPVELSGQFQTQAYMGLWSSQTFAYTINDLTDCTGYVYLGFSVSGLVLDGSEISLIITVRPGNSTTILTLQVSGQLYSNAIQYVYGDDTSSAIDFSDYGSYTYGSIDVEICYNVEWTWTVQMAITSTY
ncbi:hypothetical protein EU538_12080 [Candidatus Thorarchaeota archaeon]|nr:MAG: hypothetical protein EU538_12080 [Candidatus Thorarchaeota archaeon]